MLILQALGLPYTPPGTPPRSLSPVRDHDPDDPDWDGVIYLPYTPGADYPPVR